MPVILGNRADFRAREDLKELNADSGDIIANGEAKYVDGVRWRNDSGGDLTVPTPTDVATMEAAGFTLVEEEGGSTSHPVNALDKTYAELQTMVNNTNLTIDQWYRITDFATVNATHWGILHTADVEPLLVRAVKKDKIDWEAYSDTHSQDILHYDFEDNQISAVGYGSWEDGVDDGDTLTIFNWTTNTFDVNKVLIVDGDFVVSAEDDDGDVEYEQDGLGVDFTLTDLGNGSTRFTDLTGNINFTHPDYNYGEIQSSYKVADTKGRIYYREDKEKNIKCRFDFRGVRYARRRLDLTAIPTWSAGNYSYRNIVQYNNSIYRCMQDTSEGVTSNYWVRLFTNADRNYSIVELWSDLGLTVDTNHKMVPVFSVWDPVTSEFVEDYTKVTDVYIQSEDIVFNRNAGNIFVKSVAVEPGATASSFCGSVEGASFKYTMRRVISDYSSSLRGVLFPGSMDRVIFSGYANDSTLGSIRYSILQTVNNSVIEGIQYTDIKSMQRSKLGSMINRVRLGTFSDSRLGSNGANSYFYASYHNTIGDSCNTVTVTTNNFSNNVLGDLWRGFVIENSFNYNEFGSTTGTYTTPITLGGPWMNNVVGAYCFTSGDNNFPSTVSKCVFGSGADHINLNGTAYHVNWGAGCVYLDCSSIRDTDIGSHCTQLSFGGSVQNCSFDPGSAHITFTNTSTFRNNQIKASNINIDAANTVVTSNSLCTIFKNGAGNARMTYIDNNDNSMLIDPTTSAVLTPGFVGAVRVGAYVLPAADGSNTQVLKTDGAGTVAWDNIF